jgi:hypothetical protein
VGQPDLARSINGPCLARSYSYRAETGSGRVRAGWPVWTSILLPTFPTHRITRPDMLLKAHRLRRTYVHDWPAFHHSHMHAATATASYTCHVAVHRDIQCKKSEVVCYAIHQTRSLLIPFAESGKICWSMEQHTICVWFWILVNFCCFRLKLYIVSLFFNLVNCCWILDAGIHAVELDTWIRWTYMPNSTHTQKKAT